ncbi:MAG: hypothetical protein SP1CHLAM42_08740 [Chlamydiales bacterium]|nr:hypothetical protein [Chlamydiales bacterium]
MRQVNIPEGDPMLSSSDVPFLVPASVVRVAYKILLRTKNWYTVCFIRRAARATLDYKPMPSYSGKKLSCKGILIPGTKKIANIYLAAAICLLTVDVNRKVVILHDLMEDIGQ